MGGVRSTITFNGSVGNLTGRKTKNGLVLGIKVAPRTIDPVKGKLTLENNNEMNPVFKMSAQMYNNFEIPRIYKVQSIGTRGMLTQSLKKIQLQDVTAVAPGTLQHSRGYRDIDITTNIGLLPAGRPLGKRILSSVFGGGYTVVPAPTRISATITISVYTNDRLFKIPKGATHYAFVAGMQTVSNVQWNDATMQWEKVEPIDGDTAYAISSEIPISTPPVAPTVLTPTFGTAPVNPALNVVPWMGIIFYQKVGAIYNIMQGDIASIMLDAF